MGPVALKVILIMQEIILQNGMIISNVENEFVVIQNHSEQANCLGHVILNHGKVFFNNEMIIWAVAKSFSGKIMKKPKPGNNAGRSNKSSLDNYKSKTPFRHGDIAKQVT